jgi:hypothetical protein
MRKLFWCCLLSGLAGAGVTRWADQHTINNHHSRAASACAGIVPADGEPAGDSSTDHECVDLDSLCCQDHGETPQLKSYEVTADQPDGSKIEIQEHLAGPDFSLLNSLEYQVPLYSEMPERGCFTADDSFFFMNQLEVNVKQNTAGAEECEEGPASMPLAKEFNDVAPAFMPYIDDDGKQEAKCIFSFWMGLFAGPQVKADASEDCEPPDLTFDPNECREDPAYHHQYPGCPYTGPCPTRPSMPYPKTNTPPKAPHDEDCDVPEPIKSKSFKPYTPNDLESLLKKTNDRRKHIDTTEYRPSDALPGERKSGLTPF